MPQELAQGEREELEQILAGVFGEQEVQSLLSALEHIALRESSQGTRQDLQELHSLGAKLVEGQTGLQAALEQLAQAQARTEDRMGGLEAALERLAQAQARTEERVGGLEAALERLAQAQARTEEQVEELRKAQTQTERALRDLARQVGGLSETVGGDIEDIAYTVLYDVLGREFGWHVGVLERSWQRWNGESTEIDVFGQATDPARPDRSIWIVGEAKHNLTVRQVERFAKQVEQAKQHLTGEVFAVCFCYRARPEVRERLQELGIRLVFSYGRLV